MGDNEDKTGSKAKKTAQDSQEIRLQMAKPKNYEGTRNWVDNTFFPIDVDSNKEESKKKIEEQGDNIKHKGSTEEDKQEKLIQDAESVTKGDVTINSSENREHIVDKQLCVRREPPAEFQQDQSVAIADYHPIMSCSMHSELM